MNRRAFLAGAVAAALAGLAGCSGGGSGNYARVTGVVTHNGTPVDGAKVTFVGTTETSSGGKDEFATTTDSNGNFAISGVGKLPGLPPGLYKVKIVKLTLKSGAKVPDDFDPLQLEMSGMGVNGLPKLYASTDSSKLSATLEPGKNTANFELKGS